MDHLIVSILITVWFHCVTQIKKDKKNLNHKSKEIKISIFQKGTIISSELMSFVFPMYTHTHTERGNKVVN